MLRGPEAYKMSFVASIRDVLELHAAHGGLARAYLSAHSLARSSKQAFQQGVRRIRATDRS